MKKDKKKGKLERWIETNMRVSITIANIALAFLEDATEMARIAKQMADRAAELAAAAKEMELSVENLCGEEEGEEPLFLVGRKNGKTALIMETVMKSTELAENEGEASRAAALDDLSEGGVE